MAGADFGLPKHFYYIEFITVYRVSISMQNILTNLELIDNYKPSDFYGQ